MEQSGDRLALKDSQPFNIEAVEGEKVLKTLELSDQIYPQKFIESISRSSWFMVDGGRIFAEIRGPKITGDRSFKSIMISDFDDVILQTKKMA